MVKIEQEADASELRRVIYAMAQHEGPDGVFLTPQEIKKCLSVLPAAIGHWLKNSRPLDDGSYRGEMHDGLIVRAVPRPEKEGEAFGAVFKEGAHFDIFVKFEAGALADIGAHLGMEAKSA